MRSVAPTMPSGSDRFITELPKCPRRPARGREAIATTRLPPSTCERARAVRDACVWVVRQVHDALLLRDGSGDGMATRLGRTGCDNTAPTGGLLAEPGGHARKDCRRGGSSLGRRCSRRRSASPFAGTARRRVDFFCSRSPVSAAQTTTLQDWVEESAPATSTTSSADQMFGRELLELDEAEVALGGLVRVKVVSVLLSSRSVSPNRCGPSSPTRRSRTSAAWRTGTNAER